MDLQAAGTPPPVDEAVAKEVLRRRETTANTFRSNDAVPEPEPPAPDASYEDIDSVVLRLPNGLEVEYGPRPGVSNRVKIAQLVGAQVNPLLIMLVTTLLNVRRVNDAVPSIGNMVDVQALANRLGDDGLELLETAHIQFWRPIDRDNLPIVRKISRGS